MRVSSRSRRAGVLDEGINLSAIESLASVDLGIHMAMNRGRLPDFAEVRGDIQLLVDSTCLDESEPLPAKSASVVSSSGISEPEPDSVLPKFNEYYGVEFIDAASQTDLNQSGGAVDKGMGQEGVAKVFEQKSETEHGRSVLEAAFDNVLAAEDALVEARAVAARASYELEHVGAGLGT